MYVLLLITSVSSADFLFFTEPLGLYNSYDKCKAEMINTAYKHDLKDITIGAYGVQGIEDWSENTPGYTKLRCTLAFEK